MVVGHGPVGQAVERALRGLTTLVIDLNMDTVAEMLAQGRLAIYGDASHPQILVRARYLRERTELEQLGVRGCYEEAEAAVALTSQVLVDLGTAPDEILRQAQRVRQDTLHVLGAPRV